MKKHQKFKKIEINKATILEDMVADYIAAEGLIAFSVWSGHNCFPTQAGRLDSNGMPVALEKEEYNKLREILNIPKNTGIKRYYVDVNKLVEENLITYIGEFAQPEKNTGYDFSGLKKVVYNREWNGVDDYLNNYKDCSGGLCNLTKRKRYSIIILD